MRNLCVAYEFQGSRLTVAIGKKSVVGDRMKDLHVLKMSLISVPGLMIQSVPAGAILSTPSKSKTGGSSSSRSWTRAPTARIWFLLLALFAGLTMLRYVFTWHPQPFDDGCGTAATAGSLPTKGEPFGSKFLATAYPPPLQPHALNPNLTGVERQLWEQPDGMGYQPCIEFSDKYQRDSRNILSRGRRKYLIVVVSGGLNQQRNQIVDAVVIARILEATLVLPIMQVNMIWGDDR